eukprot:GHVR01034048.1.p1 GENE.GHVR01034048.1~~GHVR01034048.1.p1  ORF type:complete len:164 (-),score=29.30 GHVR01034048.1:897-1388(-)
MEGWMVVLLSLVGLIFLVIIILFITIKYANYKRKKYARQTAEKCAEYIAHMGPTAAKNLEDIPGMNTDTPAKELPKSYFMEDVEDPSSHSHADYHVSGEVYRGRIDPFRNIREEGGDITTNEYNSRVYGRYNTGNYDQYNYNNNIYSRNATDNIGIKNFHPIR